MLTEDAQAVAVLLGLLGVTTVGHCSHCGTLLGLEHVFWSVPLTNRSGYILDAKCPKCLQQTLRIWEPQ